MTPPADIESIRTMLTAALRMVDQLAGDGMLVRLAVVMHRVLPEDRDALLEVFEHLVVSRLLVEGDNMWVRFMPRPNPFARLFERPGGPQPDVSLPYEECLHAARVGGRVATSLPPRPSGGWRPAPETLEVARRLTPEQRAFVAATTRDIQARLRARRSA